MDRHRPQLSLVGGKRGDPTSDEIQIEPLMATNEMRNAKGWLEVIESPPQPVQDLLATHGWLCPRGKLYACGWEKHDALTRALGYSHETEIEEAGYIKLSSLVWKVGNGLGSAPTRRQWVTIEGWFTRNGFPTTQFIRLQEQVRQT